MNGIIALATEWADDEVGPMEINKTYWIMERGHALRMLEWLRDKGLLKDNDNGEDQS